ncbi:MAG: hypothetical protein RR293_05440 [Bacteroidales bacterium]
MVKKREKTTKVTLDYSETSSQRRDILDLCYKRLHEMIPECSSEVTLIKCIEILEKHEDSTTDNSDKKALCAIAATLDRLAEIK